MYLFDEITVIRKNRFWTTSKPLEAVTMCVLGMFAIADVTV